MKWARIQSFKESWSTETLPTVMEIIDISPIGRYVPELVWHECPDEVQQYWVWDEATDTYAPHNPPKPDLDALTPEEEALRNAVASGIITAEQYEQITGESYT